MTYRWPLVGLLLAVACGSGATGESRDPGAARVVTRGDFLWVAAVGGSSVLAATSPNASINEPFDYHVVDVATGKRTAARLPDAAGCATTQYLHPFDLPDRRIGLLRFCRTPDEGAGKNYYALVAYDHATGRMAVLDRMPDPIDAVARVGDREFVGGEDSLLCSSISRYRDGARVPLGITLDRDGWPLDESRGRFEKECHEHGLVRYPAGHATGGLAFFASPEAKARRGDDRLDVSFGLYVVEHGVARRIHDVDGWPRGLLWNDAGTALLVSSEGGGIVEVTLDGKTRRLASFHGDTMTQVDGGIVAVRVDDANPDEVLLVPYPPAD